MREACPERIDGTSTILICKHSESATFKLLVTWTQPRVSKCYTTSVSRNECGGSTCVADSSYTGLPVWSPWSSWQDSECGGSTCVAISSRSTGLYKFGSPCFFWLFKPKTFSIKETELLIKVAILETALLRTLATLHRDSTAAAWGFLTDCPSISNS